LWDDLPPGSRDSCWSLKKFFPQKSCGDGGVRFTPTGDERKPRPEDTKKRDHSAGENGSSTHAGPQKTHGGWKGTISPGCCRPFMGAGAPRHLRPPGFYPHHPAREKGSNLSRGAHVKGLHPREKPTNTKGGPTAGRRCNKQGSKRKAAPGEKKE